MIFGHRIKESPPRFKMTNHCRVGRTSGGKLLSCLQKVDAGEKLSFECWESIVETYDLDYL